MRKKVPKLDGKNGVWLVGGGGTAAWKNLAFSHHHCLFIPTPFRRHGSHFVIFRSPKYAQILSRDCCVELGIHIPGSRHNILTKGLLGLQAGSYLHMYYVSPAPSSWTPRRIRGKSNVLGSNYGIPENLPFAISLPTAPRLTEIV